VRCLRREERETLLELLDLWPQAEGWRGSDFFRRYIEDDATFEDRNYLVGEEGGRIVCCVQIFPRPVRMRGATVPMGGIGSVFTHPERRRRGCASRLLACATERMLERGMEVSLLFGVRSMYAALGWKPWGARVHLLSRADGAPGALPPGLRVEPFERSRDLEAVRRLHAEYSSALDGTVVRDERLWETSLRVAGNPSEEFLVARRGAHPVAYARAIVAESFLALSELGRAPDAADALAALVEQVLTPRDPDPLARPGRPSPHLRGLAALRAVPDAALEAALRARGIGWREVEDPTMKWRCLDPGALARRLGVRLEPGEDAEAFLRRVFPPGAFTFWPSDRF
jgi:GNAT superfamily N-acetyltransferase